MGQFGGFPWAKKLRQWLKFYFSFQRATYPKIRRAARRSENYSIFALKYSTNLGFFFKFTVRPPAHRQGGWASMDILQTRARLIFCAFVWTSFIDLLLVNRLCKFQVAPIYSSLLVQIVICMVFTIFRTQSWNAGWHQFERFRYNSVIFQYCIFTKNYVDLLQYDTLYNSIIKW